MAVRARDASRKLQALPSEERVAMLNRVADALLANEGAIMEANAQARRSYYRPNKYSPVFERRSSLLGCCRNAACSSPPWGAD